MYIQYVYMCIHTHTHPWLIIPAIDLNIIFLKEIIENLPGCPKLVRCFFFFSKAGKTTSLLTIKRSTRFILYGQATHLLASTKQIFSWYFLIFGGSEVVLAVVSKHNFGLRGSSFPVIPGSEYQLAFLQKQRTFLLLTFNGVSGIFIFKGAA